MEGREPSAMAPAVDLTKAASGLEGVWKFKSSPNLGDVLHQTSNVILLRSMHDV